MIETSIRYVHETQRLKYTYGGDIVLNTPRDNRKDSEDSEDDMSPQPTSLSRATVKV